MSPRTIAVLVIDMLNDYLSPGGKLLCEPCRSIIPPLQDFLARARQRGWLVVYVNTSLDHEAEPLARKWGLHARNGTWGSEVIADLAPQPRDIIVTKKTYDGFYATDLEARLVSHGVTDVVLAGIHTHVCILATAFGAFARGFDVTVLEDCITTETPANHESRLTFFASHIGRLTSSTQLLAETARP